LVSSLSARVDERPEALAEYKTFSPELREKFRAVFDVHLFDECWC
jgi:hypothetical protein